MSPDSPRARRAGLRLLAAAAAGCTAAGAFAVPAAAVDIPGIEGDPVASVQLAPDLDGTEMVSSSMTVDYTPAVSGDTATHAVVTELVFDDPYGVLDITTADPACDVSTPASITCTADSGSHTEFLFNALPALSAEDGTIGYTFKATVDGTEVKNATGDYAVVADYDVHHPYAHGDVVRTDVTSGASSTFVTVNPVIYQDFDLAPTAAAAVVTFTHPTTPVNGIDTTDLITSSTHYGNCRAAYEGSGTARVRVGVSCVITDLPDAKGQYLTLTKNLNYFMDQELVGPLELCGCTYSIETIDAATLASEYDNLSWVSPTASKIGLTTTTAGWEGAEDSIEYYSGDVSLTTVDNTYDLDLDETVISGVVGNTVTITTEVENSGLAVASDLNPDGAGYLFRGQLPEGIELIQANSNNRAAWDCYSPDELAAVYAETSDTLLDHFDFACALTSVSTSRAIAFTFTAKIADTGAVQGAIEIGAIDAGAEYEADVATDFAVISTDLTETRYDYNQDYNEDLFVIRKSDGALRFYAGTDAGAHASAVTVGSGWGKMDIVMAGDLTGDGLSDLLVRDNQTGTLYTYPGKGDGTLGSRITVGTGWGKMGQIAVGNYDGDGKPDLLATAFSDGNMYLYPGLGNGKFAARTLWSEWWDGMDVITTAGDVDGDGYDEFLTRWNFTGYYYLVSLTSETVIFDQSMGNHAELRRYDQVIGAGDLKRDGMLDFLTVELSTGRLLRQTLMSGSYTVDNAIGNSGWNSVRLPVVNLDRTYDYDGDGFSDFIAQRKSDGDLRLYFGTGNGHATPWVFCADCDGITGLSAGGDYDSDGRLDVVYRAYTGGLYVIQGVDDGEHYGFDGTDIYVGSGWNAMGDISGGHDYTSDGRDDLVARHAATGTLYVYPGKGDGTFGTRIKVGTGWNGMRETSAVGDLDHDGYADLLSISKSDSCLYLYKGNGNGTFKSRVKISCGWGGYDAITGVGDFNRDGHADFITRRKSDGALFLYPGNGAGGTGARKQIGTGWNSMMIA
ncbi:FG-GAP repeat domain-containing protein [Glycomyces algeriensis]|uniref:VCBS repeat protein n=1 Tax=Glycomyces algeriensis TaxID=256037 RepID=A0A9W6G6N4_9ACTN|nr:VCBS repeat-containing protein [Glycomyces algeriensis]MDA1366346.1 VCBS repeat-containing protein [Glycomyces algeriensis]MDR7348694.1 hypothetical protein [Glycomyces algeriensis]GLI41396.1 hypothetical protein GALLR39Z86_12460 [Glycomyces algeriensis]